MFLAKTLSFYKRPEIRQAIAEQALNKEVSIHYSNYFGKRPEAIYSDGDVLDFAKNKASSFHCSEELWRNPLQIKTGMGKKEIEQLRVGWDLILDIDCPYWPLSKLITHLFIKALKAHGITAVTVKFSGNKGFHIAVPFEAFPENVNGTPTKDLFPEAPRRIAHYLLDYLAHNYVEESGDYFIFDKKRKIGKVLLAEKLGMTVDQFYRNQSADRGDQDKPKITLLCRSCGWTTKVDRAGGVHQCKQCGTIMSEESSRSERSSQSGGANKQLFDPLTIIEVDTILIAHRHLYRMPYSFHEKSQLVSVPIPIDKVLSFTKDQAKPETVKPSVAFLDRDVKAGEASKLFIAAFDYQPRIEAEVYETKKEFEIPEEAIPAEYFPPCITNILKGVKDGRKRSLFTLINFLRGVGWSHEQIEQEIEEWNKRNDEAMREVEVKGRLRYEKTKKQPMPPHNCRRYYEDFQVCQPDAICQGIKNPLQYAKKKAAQAGIGKKGTRAKLTEEQKQARREYRAKQAKREQEASNEENS